MKFQLLILILLPIAAVAVIPSSPAAAAELQAGVAVTDLTPPLGWRMSGYFHERLSTGTHDPLRAKAVVFRQGDRQLAMVFCDLIGIAPDVSRRVRQRTEQQTGIPASHVLIAATHSHTGPLYFGALRQRFHDAAVAQQGSDPQESIDFTGRLVDKLVAAIVAARASAEPVRLQAGIARQQGLAFNRRFHMKDGSASPAAGGTVRFNPGKLNPNIVRPAGPMDPDVGILLMRNRADDHAIASLTVFALHLDTVGGTEYSADYPYYLGESLRKKLGAGFVSLFGNGTCGDINHIDVSHRRPQKGQQEARRIGDTLAATVAAHLDKLREATGPSLAARLETVSVPLQKFSAEEVARAKRDMARVGDREMPFLERVQTYKIMALQARGGDSLPMIVQVFRIAEDVAIVALPGEVFVDLGLAIKRASPFAVTMVIELAHDAPGYVPTRKAFAEGSYETVNSRIRPGGGELLAETAVRLLKELKTQAPAAEPLDPPVQAWFPKAPALPKPQGQVIEVSSVEELFRAAAEVEPGGTILLADGHYMMPRYFELGTDNVTMRSASGRRDRVILDGARSRHGELVGITACSGVTVADLTIQNIKYNGFKLNSDKGVQRVTIYNCIIHNIWQRGVKGVAVPKDKPGVRPPAHCRVQYCLFYNDRPKRFSDDPTDTPRTFGGNYVGGIDVMYADRWTISDNVFVGIKGRTGEARGAVFLWHDSQDCVVERNVILDCNTGICLGNSHKKAETKQHCWRCVVRNNFLSRAPENGILADYTRDCAIVHNTIHDPTSRLKRLIRLVHDNDGLLVANNLLSGPPMRVETDARVRFSGNVTRVLGGSFVDERAGNLHLKAAVPGVLGGAARLPNVMEDIDRQRRNDATDIGADQLTN